ncbi:MAG: hybrid sensor histidine kinase/response regulator [Desulfobulbaceae bacterium]
MSDPARNKKILLIDDDALMRKSATMLLKSLGYSVFAAENGREGLDLYYREHPDLMLLDLRMPVMDGFEVLAELGSALEDFPVIIISGAGGINDALKTLQLGASDYLVKPILDISVLEHAINKALERIDLIRENRRYQHYLEEEIKKRTAELQHSQKMEAIGTLAGGIAHDFNNILAIINGYAQMAQSELPPESQPSQDLDKVLHAANRASELVKQILTFSRQDDHEAKPVHVQFIFKEILKLLKASFPSTIVIRDSVDANCPPVLADPSRIHQVIMNLCTNAWHAMRESGGELSVSLSHLDRLPAGFRLKDKPQPAAGYLLLQVTDTGHGIDGDDLNRIFEPFFTTKPVSEGTGLGLSVVHGIVKSLGGDILVSSEKGHGADFRIIFPALAEDTAFDLHLSSPLPRGDERIMVVDDEAELASWLQRFLHDLGYKVTTHSDSRAALDAFLAAPDAFDLIVTDMTMPGLTGKELAREIMLRRPELPVILCTGFSESLDRDQALAIGIREYVMKPVVRQELAEIVRKVLDHG